LQNLFTFGCSHTFGMCLPDRGASDLLMVKNSSRDLLPKDYTDINTLHGSKYAWGQLLADKLSMNCVNRGVIGASVKETLWHFDQTLSVIKPSDIVCFLWPYAYRYNLLTSNKGDTEVWDHREINIIDGRRWFNDMSSDAWHKIFDPYDAGFTNHVYIQYVHLLLKEMNIQSYHMFCDDHIEIPAFYTDVNIITDTHFNKVRDQNDMTGVEDDEHGGVETHNAIAILFHQLITRVGAND